MKKIVNALTLLIFILAILRLKNILHSEGLERELFFDEDSPIATNRLFEMITTVIFIPILLFYNAINKPNYYSVLALVLFSISTFSRSGLTMLAFALLVNPNIPLKKRFYFTILFLVFSYTMLSIRLQQFPIDDELLNLFFQKYSIVGVSRLLATNQADNINIFHMLGILLKPLDAFFWVIDYLGNLAGNLSAGRLAAISLNEFKQGFFFNGEKYNAFGTILFPFFYVFGKFIGTILFIQFIVIYYCLLRYFLKDKNKYMPIIRFFLISGFLFSYCDPFIWIIPFIFFKRQGNTKLYRDTIEESN